MYDISELEVTGKDIAIGVLVCVAVLVVCFCAGYLCGWERAEDVYCNGTGIGTVSNELGQVGTNISNAEAGIGQAEGHADKVANGIESAKESAIYIEGTAKTSADIIRQSKSIIATIRKRGKENTPTN